MYVICARNNVLVIMDINSGVNPAQSDSVRAELYVDSETVTFHREPPPPYDAVFRNVPVTNQPVSRSVNVQPTLKLSPTLYTCPTCEERIVTKVEYSSTQKTHMLAGFIFGFSCWCALCFLAGVPYLIKTFKIAHHYCPNCSTLLGAYSKI